MNYRFLEHPGDLKLQVFAQDFTGLFQNAAQAMMFYLFGKNRIGQRVKSKKIIIIKAKDNQSLLVDWLSELLYLADTYDICFFQYKFKKLSETELEAITFGFKAVAKKDIKAVTYHGLEIKKKNNGFRANILFDI